MNAADVLGLLGVSLILAAYAGAQLRRLDPTRAPALLINLAGALLVVVSLLHAFNLPAFLVEAAWGAIALAGLLRLGVRRLRRPRRADPPGAEGP